MLRPAATWAGVLAGTVAFTASLLVRWPVPWYLPEARAWWWGLTPPGLGMDFYGRHLLSVVAALGAALGVEAVARWAPAPVSRAVDGLGGLLGGWALVAVAVGTWVLGVTLAMRP